MRSLVTILLAVCAFWGGPMGHARADEAEGQRLLEEAVLARDQGRLLDAERLIRASLEAHRWTYPAFQLANVLREMGRPADAATILDALASGAYGDVTGPALDALGEARREVARRYPS